MNAYQILDMAFMDCKAECHWFGTRRTLPLSEGAVLQTAVLPAIFGGQQIDEKFQSFGERRRIHLETLH